MAKPKPIPLSQEELKALLTYCPTSGELTWKPRGNPAWDSKCSGKKAGSEFWQKGIAKQIQLQLVGRMYSAHRIIWKMVTGDEPPEAIDHIDGDPFNNKWVNLRDGSGQINSMNRGISSSNTSGVTGVHWNKTARKWCARIQIKGGTKYLGLFPTVELAEAAVKEARNQLGFTERHGSK